MDVAMGYGNAPDSPDSPCSQLPFLLGLLAVSRTEEAGMLYNQVTFNSYDQS